eukprot:GFKZ01011732.1.p1 GENE.GFKZ01011732.1~~GFKZ01011732.1.p1  ORF type:complete len:373 (-),score=32.43 GFKZ01011732.1:786-1811(-)
MGARPTRYAAAATNGRSRVWCHGLCMTGPDYRGTILTLLIALTVLAAELAVAFPFLFRNHPMVAIPLLVAQIVSFTITIWSAYLAATTDPGIIPRATSTPASYAAAPAVRERRLIYHGRPILVKYCDTCRIWRPPRTSHCATCNNCVRRFDHHCPWLGNDIGLRNYRSYFTFVSVATIAEILAITVSVLTIHWSAAGIREEFPMIGYGESLRRALSGAVAVNLVVILICILALAFTGGLTGFHLYLMWNNVTTAESFKKRNRNGAHVHDDLRGCEAICFLQCTRRDASAVTDGYLGPAYPEEEEITRLVNQQVEEERMAQMEEGGEGGAPARVVMGSAAAV